jgi:hypothetical protein
MYDARVGRDELRCVERLLESHGKADVRSTARGGA